ncbi:hypothetical protein [Streptoalloteichus tenebrarius]|uniref:hypothetical protein n=1 Tax=Streptoalloteichus tenebrarius (strain ATCC 17920 / DSM 40477 / JCM 4838 / CBS 697.72 / NBRC 16177 / NCIMB 11028 / NRRL B-12390 / A12253. 1 / ISP 5477) TaxID=1933 RepID=UPI0020A41EB2|nr:hypothetical protein [Streptoalloteichus tenebrarius]
MSVDGVRVETDWLREYAKRVDQGAQALRRARDTVDAHPLPPEAFGELGRTVRVADAYGRAAALLRQQLDRACEVLGAAGVGLVKVAEHYEGHDSNSASTLRRAHRG